MSFTPAFRKTDQGFSPVIGDTSINLNISMDDNNDTEVTFFDASFEENEHSFVPVLQSDAKTFESKIETLGRVGEPGLSAYQIWLQQGNAGTEQDFLDSLKASYTHPTTHPASMISETTEKMFMSKEEKDKALKTFVFEQRLASKDWVIVHNLNKLPSAVVVDTAGSIVSGEIMYISENEVVISFSSEFSGKVFLN